MVNSLKNVTVDEWSGLTAAA